jgi:hypothetical protein
LNLSHRGSLLLVVGLALGLAGCQYFTDVVVPATDTTPPVAVSGVYDLRAGYVRLGFGDPFEYVVTDPATTYLAVGASWDDGGAESVQITGGLTLYCDNGHGLGQTQTEDFAPKSASQKGSVGSVVSDGVWTYYVIRFDQVGCATEGFQLRRAVLGWSTRATDFHGNQSVGSGSMVYKP